MSSSSESIAGKSLYIKSYGVIVDCLLYSGGRITKIIIKLSIMEIQWVINILKKLSKYTGLWLFKKFQIFYTIC